jgi:two-component system, NtrC family, nitrogen regulation response regulator GlnG
MHAPQVLVVSCHLSHSKPLAVALERIGVRTALAFSAEKGSRMLTADEIPVVCCCAKLPDGDYRSILSVIRSKNLRTRLLVVSEAQECNEYLQAMQAGAFDFVPVPYQMKEVERILRNALELPEPAQAVAVSSSGQT